MSSRLLSVSRSRGGGPRAWKTSRCRSDWSWCPWRRPCTAWGSAGGRGAVDDGRSPSWDCWWSSSCSCCSWVRRRDSLARGGLGCSPRSQGSSSGRVSGNGWLRALPRWTRSAAAGAQEVDDRAESRGQEQGRSETRSGARPEAPPEVLLAAHPRPAGRGILGDRDHESIERPRRYWCRVSSCPAGSGGWAESSPRRSRSHDARPPRRPHHVLRTGWPWALVPVRVALPGIDGSVAREARVAVVAK